METATTTERVAKVFNGTYTLESTRTGQHRTLSVRTQADDAKFAPGKRVVALLTGPDNEHDYQGFGFMDDRGVYVWRSKKGKGQASQYEALADILWDLATQGEGGRWYARGYRLHVEGRCIRCNRKLTRPDSIKRGAGETCLNRI